MNEGTVQQLKNDLHQRQRAHSNSLATCYTTQVSTALQNQRHIHKANIADQASVPAGEVPVHIGICFDNKSMVMGWGAMGNCSNGMLCQSVPGDE